MSDDLVKRVEVLELAVEVERSLNVTQQEAIAKHVQRNERSIDTLAAGTLGFAGFVLVIVVTGLRLEWDGGSFALPANFLEITLGALTAFGASGGAVNLVSRLRGE